MNPQIRYISDLHFSHDNVLSFDDRPWVDIESHDAGLVVRWNDVVGRRDLTYILGDFCWGKYDRWRELMRSLNGRKIVIRGNHDRTGYLQRLLEEGLISAWFDYREVSDNGRMVVLCHYPIVSWNGLYRNSYHLYGHVHATYDYNVVLRETRLLMQLYEKPCRSFNVGAMVHYMDYRPRTLDEIVEKGREDLEAGRLFGADPKKRVEKPRHRAEPKTETQSMHKENQDD